MFVKYTNIRTHAQKKKTNKNKRKEERKSRAEADIRLSQPIHTFRFMAIIIEEKPSLTLGLFINGAICKCDKVIKRQLNYMDMGYKVTQKQHPVKSNPSS